MEMSIDDQPVSRGTGSDCLGDPLHGKPCVKEYYSGDIFL
jgi:hypothetical protein